MFDFYNNKNGKYKIFCKNSGKLIIEKHYSNDLLDGKFTYYWDNGNIRFSGQFSNNRRIGTWTNYDKNGAIVFEESFN